MLELKFFKELPCRSLNNNKSFVELAGADLYNDKEGNRYAFLSFKNNYKGPFFSLYLYLKEYDSSGTFLKENKFSVPNIYGKTGLHVINEPIELEKECEGIEVYIYLAEYIGKNFYNDAFVTPGNEKIELNMAAMKNQAKASTNSQSRPVSETVIEGNAANQEVQYDENGEEVPVQQEVSSASSMANSANAVVSETKGIFNFATIALGILAIVLGIIFCVAILPNFIYNANNPVSGGGAGGNGGGGGDWDFDFIKVFFQNLLK